MCGGAQLVEYPEASAPGLKQDYFVELWDVGAAAPIYRASAPYHAPLLRVLLPIIGCMSLPGALNKACKVCLQPLVLLLK